MRLLVSFFLIALCSSAQAFTLKTGSWGYEYPGDWLVKPDGQSLHLTGSQGFSFNGIVGDYWIDVNRCQAGAAIVPCPPNTIRVNWYAGTTDGMTHKGVGCVGTVVWNGVTYTNVGAASSGRRLQFYTYGTMTLPPLGMNGLTKIKTMTTPINGSFEHGGIFTPIGGNVVVTVEFEQVNGKWVIEATDYDIVTP